MDQKERNKIKERKYRKTRIDRHNSVVNKFMDDAKASKKSITRSINELIDRESLLQAQLRQNEKDKVEEIRRICSVLFRNMLPDYRAGQLELWIAAFIQKFILKNPDYELQNVIEAIMETERFRLYGELEKAIPIKKE